MNSKKIIVMTLQSQNGRDEDWVVSLPDQEAPEIMGVGLNTIDGETVQGFTKFTQLMR